MTNKSKKTYVTRDVIPDFDPSVPSRESILEALRATPKVMSVASLIKHFKLKQQALIGLDRRIGAMERDGQLSVSDKGRIKLLTSDTWVQGTIQGHKDGFGFLIPDAGGDDVYLPYKEMLKAMHGDRVVVKVTGKDARGRLEGIVLEVLGSSIKKIVGRLISDKQQYVVLPEDKRITHEIVVSKDSLGGAKVDQIVCVELLRSPSRQMLPQGKVVEILGAADDPGMEIEIAVRKFDVPHVFSSACMAESERLPDHVLATDLTDRVDLRDIPFITIDGEDARDFDDAVYVEACVLKNGRQSIPAWRLLVAIADVSHYVTSGSAIDIDAFERSTSVYFPRRVIPMLPEKLSNGLCSLVPDEDRLTLVCDMVIPTEGSDAGVVQAYQFYNAVIHSAARTTYNEVWSIIEGTDGVAHVKHQKVIPQMVDLYALFKLLSKARHDRGAIDFETIETKMVVNEAGRIEKIQPMVRNDAHKLIEEAMLTANTCAADFMERSHHLGLYRVHEGPSEDRLTSLRAFLKSLSLTLPGGDDPQAKDYATLMAAIKDRPDYNLIQTMALRSLHQAMYTPDNVGHFGLSYKAYTHFTSPIRRYPDLLTHRVIKSLIQGKRYTPKSLSLGKHTADVDTELSTWESLGMHCSKNERRADDASRDVEAWLKAQFMKNHLGDTYTGSITGVTQFGLFITLDELYVEGLLHISDIQGDYYQFNDVLHELKGERTGKRYRLTDRLQVKVARVDLDTRRIEFVLPEATGSQSGYKRSVSKVSSAKSAKRTPSAAADSSTAKPQVLSKSKTTAGRSTAKSTRVTATKANTRVNKRK